MKTTMKAVLIAFCIFSVCSSIQAQENKNSEVGIKGGLNFSNLYSEEVDDQNMRTSFHAGMYFKAALNHFLAIQPEVLYSRKGSTTKYDNLLTGDGEFSNNLDYLELPVLGVFNLTENINVHAGPYFAYLLNAEIQNESENSDFNFVEELNEDDFERLDYGVAAGVGFEFETIRFGLRYNYGLTDVGKSQGFTLNGSEYQSDQFKNMRNSTLSLYLGLTLN